MRNFFIILFTLYTTIISAQSDTTLEFQEYPKTGVKQTLFVRYDDDNIFSTLELVGNDTCKFFKMVDKDLEKRLSYWYVLGSVYHGEKYHLLSNSSSDSKIIKKNRVIKYQYNLNTLPVIVENLDTIEFRLYKKNVDSIVFSYTGKANLSYVKPTPTVLQSDSAIWSKTDMLLKGDTIIFKLVFERKASRILPFSRYTLQDLNENLPINYVIQNLGFCALFICLWLMLLQYKELFTVTIDEKAFKNILKYLYLLSLFYFVLFIAYLLYSFDSIDPLKEHVNIPRNRIYIMCISVSLYLASWFLKKTYRSTPLIYFGKVLALISQSCLVYISIIFIHFIVTNYTSYTFDGLIESSRLYIKIKDSWAISVVVGIMLSFCLYKMFSFNRKVKFGVLALGLFIPVMELYNHFIQQTKYSESTSTNLNGVLFIETILFLIAPLILIVSLLFKLKGDQKPKLYTRFCMFSFLFIFCFYCTPSLYDYYFGAPISLLIGLALFAILFAKNFNKGFKFLSTKSEVFNLEKQNISVFTKIFELRQYNTLKEKYKEKFLSGDLLPADYDNAITDLNKKISDCLPNDLKPKTVQLRMEYGLYENPIKNAETGFISAFFISIPLLVLYYNFLPQPIDNSFINDPLITSLMRPCGVFLIAGFTFGYYYSFLPGNFGWKKGFYLGIVMVCCKLIFQLLTSGQLSMTLLLLPLMREILIMTLIGFIAFDLSIIKKIYGSSFKPKYVIQIEGISNILIFATVVISAIAAGITAWLSNSVSQIINNITP